MTVEQLAKLCILVLNAQRNYFATRHRDDLVKSKALETQLRNEANSILSKIPPAAVQERMF